MALFIIGIIVILVNSILWIKTLHTIHVRTDSKVIIETTRSQLNSLLKDVNRNIQMAIQLSDSKIAQLNALMKSLDNKLEAVEKAQQSLQEMQETLAKRKPRSSKATKKELLQIEVEKPEVQPVQNEQSELMAFAPSGTGGKVVPFAPLGKLDEVPITKYGFAQEVRRLHSAGLPKEDIARRLGVTLTEVKLVTEI